MASKRPKRPKRPKRSRGLGSSAYTHWMAFGEGMRNARKHALSAEKAASRGRCQQAQEHLIGAYTHYGMAQANTRDVPARLRREAMESEAATTGRLAEVRGFVGANCIISRRR